MSLGCFQSGRGYILDSLYRLSLRIRISSLISQKAKYALRALVALAKEGDSLMIGEIAVRKNIPRKFLEQILLEMKRHGIVHSRRGKFGGYSLLMAPDKITYGQVCASSMGRSPPCLASAASPIAAALTARPRKPAKSGGFLPGSRSWHERCSTARPSPIPSSLDLLADEPEGGDARDGASLRRQPRYPPNWKQIPLPDRFVADGASTHLKKW